jgi:hypothetical protein
MQTVIRILLAHTRTRTRTHTHTHTQHKHQYLHTHVRHQADHGSSYPYSAVEIRARDPVTGQEAGLTIPATVRCRPGLVSNVWSAGSVCAECPSGADCNDAGRTFPSAKPGFYPTTSYRSSAANRSTTFGASSMDEGSCEGPASAGVREGSVYFVACEPSWACDGGCVGGSSPCREGHTGFRCGLCEVRPHVPSIFPSSSVEVVVIVCLCVCVCVCFFFTETSIYIYYAS